jgi:hypothetical protein
MLRLPNNTFSFEHFTESEAADYLLMCGLDCTAPKEQKLAFAKPRLESVTRLLWQRLAQMTSEQKRTTAGWSEARAMESLARKMESLEGLIQIVKLAGVADFSRVKAGQQ